MKNFKNLTSENIALTFVALFAISIVVSIIHLRITEPEGCAVKYEASKAVSGLVCSTQDFM